MRKQWHPLFARLVRPLLEAHFEFHLNMPVGEVPRQADLVLLQRTSHGTLPYVSIWRYLTRWNVLEFKGPTVSPRSRDLDRLVELGLGIDRRLSRLQRPRRPVWGRDEVSFWYLANRLGQRWLREARTLVPDLVPLGPGLWRGHVLQRPLLLVSTVDLPVEAENVPLHLVGQEPPAQEREVAELVVTDTQLWGTYGNWLASLHPAIWEEVRAMARRLHGEFQIDLRPLIQELGLAAVIEQAGLDQVIEQVGLRKVVEHVGLERLLASLTPAQRRELKQRLS